ncbi:MAG: HAD hydrolase-like protein [Microthrixaceae bacterium]
MIVIFDLDGTVWDSEEGIVASLQHTFESFDMAVPDRATMTANLGPPLQLMLAELGIPADLVDEATLRYRERYVERGVYEAQLYPGIADTLGALRSSGHRLATATSKGERPTLQMVEHFGLAEHFEFVGAASMDSSAITKEAVLARTLTALGDPDPSGCWMVGDRSYDVTGSARHDIACIGVLWGYGTEDELRAAGAAHLVREPAELLEILGRAAGDPGLS